jgi:putative peptidoglycan lipid II flippase
MVTLVVTRAALSDWFPNWCDSTAQFWRNMINTLQVGQRRWNAWRVRSSNTRIFAAMVTVGGLTILVKVAAAAKELIIAYQFGTSDALDAFLIAFVLPGFAITLVYGSLNAALIPTYIEVREREGQEAAQRLSSSIMVSSGALLVVVSILFALLAPYILPILALGFDTNKLMLTRSLYYVLIPCLLFSGLATTWSAILNAEERFALAAIGPILTALVTVLMMIALAKAWGVFSLAVGTVAGSLLEAALLGWWLGRQGISVVPRWYGVTPAVRQVWGQYAPIVAGSFLMGSTSLVAQSMAAMLGSGSVSALAYGSKITMLILGVGSVAVSTAVLPHFSRMVALGDWGNVRHTLLTYARLIMLITLPLTLVLIYFSEPLIRLLFQRGAFVEADTRLVAWVQALYLLQVPVFVMGMLSVRLISALRANRVLMWGAAINLVFNIACSYVMMKWLGIAGIALSISLMYLVSCSYLTVVSLRLLKEKSIPFDLK